MLQRAVAMLLEAVYEQDFLDRSFGFRPGRSPHAALEALRAGAMQMHGGVVLDADIKAFFDTLDHQRLNESLDRRVRDGSCAVSSRSGFTRALARIAEWMRLNRHRPVTEQHKTLVQKLRGHFNYYGVTCNTKALRRFAFEVARRWKRWLGRRSQRARLSQERFKAFVVRFPLPAPRLVRSVYRSAANL